MNIFTFNRNLPFLSRLFLFNLSAAFPAVPNLGMSAPYNGSRSNGWQRGAGYAASHNRRGGPPLERMAPSYHFASVSPELIRRLKNAWALLKKSDNVKQILFSVLETSDNPYAVALQIISECEDLFHGKANTLAAYIIEEFCGWAKSREQQIQHNLTPELKYDAFCFITMQRNSSLTKLILATFRMEDDKALFVEKIQHFIYAKKYKEACQCAVALNMIDQYPIEHIILPLVLQDKISIAEEALATNLHLQVQLVTRLDMLVGDRCLRNTVEHLVHQLEVPDVKLDRFTNYKPLGKLVAKLVKTFNLPSDCTPNLNQKRSAGALNFIFGKRFYDKTLSLDSWKEMAYDAVKDSKDLQIELVVMLNNYNEVEEAFYWAMEFNIPQHKWPYNVKEHLKQNPFARHEFPRPNSPEEQQQEDWNDSNQFHSLSLPDSAIVMVDSEESLRECLLFINNHECKIVGIDSEWKPAFGAQQNELSLIQLATWDRIFILDVIGMLCLPPEVWMEACSLFFENPSILKLGFSMGTDLAMIRSAIAPLANLKRTGSGYLDLSQLWRCLQNKGMTFPYPDKSNSGGESLSKLVSLCFGRCLDKSDQFSNWEQRPLRTGQRRYAALDAFCLLELYRDMKKLANEQGLPFLEICDEIIMEFRSPKKNYASSGRGRGRGRRPPGGKPNPGQGPSQGQEEGLDGLEIRGVSTLKFVADVMLCGLGRQLRRCGIDCLILEAAIRKKQSEEANTILENITKEERIVLSQGSNVDWFESHLCPESVYCVESSAASDQLQEVLDHFGIIVFDTDIFSRCQVCNSNDFDRVRQDTMVRVARLPPLGMEDPCSRGVTTATASTASYSADSKLKNENKEKGELPEPRPWNLTDNDECARTGQTHLGTKIDIEVIPEDVIRRIQVFYVCAHCGKVYWEGSHLSRTVDRYKAAGTVKLEVKAEQLGGVYDTDFV
ncbi:exonuclease mut-7 homolog [Thrips palmi]|uniref:Exonuclease mut-7 homolog n=1 Tax=Thrips palmi TaxID=161013 RepID=A0A6P8Y7Z9_THRPL|nr:exonuclease mut-7 homolog [Thrips palmi]